LTPAISAIGDFLFAHLFWLCKWGYCLRESVRNAIFAGMIFSFFKTPRHQRFNYEPRYWNPEEEERAERLKKLRGEADGTTLGPRKISFRRQHPSYQEASKKSNRNIIFLIFLIASLVFLIFNAMISIQTAILCLAALIAWRSGVFTRFFERLRGGAR